MLSSSRPKRWIIATTAVAALLPVAACGSDNDGTTTGAYNGKAPWSHDTESGVIETASHDGSPWL